MIEVLDRILTSIKGKGRSSKLARFLIRQISNQLIPIYFLLFSDQERFLKRKKNSGCDKVVISLTSFPARIKKLWIVFECMFRQSYLPDEVILYLAKEQFPEGFGSVPKKLRQFANMGLIRILFVEEDLRSHKKYYYSFQEFRESIVILIDDDLIYTKNLIKGLIDLHEKYPKSICCHRAHGVRRTPEGKLSEYKKWSVLREFHQPSRRIFHTSGGGTLYRPELFNDELFDKEVFRNLCLTADDVWLNIHAHLSGIKIVKSDYFTTYIPIQSARDVKLSKMNVNGGQNDKQIQQTLKYYDIDEERVFND